MNIVRSFIFFTIVIITPVSDLTTAAKQKEERDASASPAAEGNWYIGALGHWWVGGSVDLPRFRRHERKELFGKEEGSGIDLRAGVLGFIRRDQYGSNQGKDALRYLLLHSPWF